MADPIPSTDVLIVGAGPAGLMLATQLTRYGIPLRIIDSRTTATECGRADGLQPKTIETLKQLRLCTPLLERGVKIYDISFWSDGVRERREVHYPAGIIDVLEPYVLLCHQGMVEAVFLDDMKLRGVGVERSAVFESYVEGGEGEYPVEAVYQTPEGEKRIRAKYVVGCDGAHSAVRRCMDGVEMVGESEDVFWGALDGVIETDFPDLWSKCVISSSTEGTILCIPRERNMTRLYIELTSSPGEPISKSLATPEFVQSRASAILAPFKVSWRTIDWFGVYQIGQRIASSFKTPSNRVLIAGDAAHTHSPKAAQGMNVSIHDSHNLAWKLAMVLSGLADEKLLDTYEEERRKIAQDLIAFDYEHAKAFSGNDADALAENFKTNIRFISGVGAVYNSGVLSKGGRFPDRKLNAGELLPPSRATRYMDANPVDLQLDIPVLGQFRIYFLAPAFDDAREFLIGACDAVENMDVLSRTRSDGPAARADEFVQPLRYTTAGNVITPALITRSKQSDFELAHLPNLLRNARWTVYMDNLEDEVSPLNGKWTAGLKRNQVQIVIVRPDGYVGAVSKRHATDNYWGGASVVDARVQEAVQWIREYFSFLKEEKCSEG